MGVLHKCMLDLRNCVLCLPVSGTVVCIALNINMQVLWLGKEDVNVTWEPASSLPQAVVDEFEKGVECTAVQQNSDFYGQKTCTLHIETKTLQSSASKRPRTDRPVIQSNDGWVLLILIN